MRAPEARDRPTRRGASPRRVAPRDEREPSRARRATARPYDDPPPVTPTHTHRRQMAAAPPLPCVYIGERPPRGRANRGAHNNDALSLHHTRVAFTTNGRATRRTCGAHIIAGHRAPSSHNTGGTAHHDAHQRPPGPGRVAVRENLMMLGRGGGASLRRTSSSLSSAMAFPSFSRKLMRARVLAACCVWPDATHRAAV